MTGDSYVATEAADCPCPVHRSVFLLVKLTDQPVLAGSVRGERIDRFFDDVGGAGLSADDLDEHAADLVGDELDEWVRDGLDAHRWEQRCRR